MVTSREALRLPSSGDTFRGPCVVTNRDQSMGKRGHARRRRDGDAWLKLPDGVAEVSGTAEALARPSPSGPVAQEAYHFTHDHGKPATCTRRAYSVGGMRTKASPDLADGAGVATESDPFMICAAVLPGGAEPGCPVSASDGAGATASTACHRPFRPSRDMSAPASACCTET
jgi:hypothetical protein